ncbi:MAG: thiamine pyrophosphate-dependent enzyme [Pirellulales bacterium]|nr:thiamine pyrophosphate-dependent enzyme [Pirellulales bacterium]
MPHNAAHLMLEMLAEFGVQHLFGNPGTTEMPLMDALMDDACARRIRYVLGLQEVPVVAAADGYAQASGSLGVVNLHISCGLGNAMGMLYNAWSAGTPLLITAGQQHRKLLFSDPVLAGDMVSVAKPWTKWASEVNRVEDLPTALRRAIQTALTPPTGPTFLSLPIDLQAELTEISALPPNVPDVKSVPPSSSISAAAELLLTAENSLILAGSRALECGATDETVRLAELAGAAVLVDPPSSHGRMGFPCDHPLFAGWLSHDARAAHERLSQHDVVLAVGIELLRTYLYFDDTSAVPESVRLIQIDDNPNRLGKNFVPELAVLGHPQPTLASIATHIQENATQQFNFAAMQRKERLARKHEDLRSELRAEISRQAAGETAESMSHQTNISPFALMGAIANVLPTDVAVIEEAATTTSAILQRLGAIQRPDGYFGHRGWALGWGLGCAVGVSLAWPQRPVLAILGDGGALYGIQGLWTAARENLPVTFLIANNRSYEILKHGARALELPNARENRFVGLDLNDPEIDYLALSQSFGVPAVRAKSLDDVRDLLTDSFAARSPRLIEVLITESAHGPR